jgi:hypothetical protein
MPIITRNNSSQRSSLQPTDETNLSYNNVNESKDKSSSSYEVRPDNLTYKEILDLSPEVGRIVYDSTNETERYWDGGSWQSMSGTSSSSVGQRAANYSSLTDGNTVGELAYCNQSQGTQWLPSTLGGTYYPQGWYIWDGSVWTSDRNSIVNQLQLNVDGLGGKANINHTHIKADITDFNDGDYATQNQGGLAETALQPNDNISDLNNDEGFITEQITDAEITALGYVKTDTQLTDAEIAAFGYVKTDTQLTDQEIADFGYIKEGGLTDEEIGDLGYIKESDALPLAKGASLGLKQELLASAGQPALTVLAVGATTSGKVQGCSLGDGNVIEVFASGSDFNSNTVLYREFMSAGEPICFTGLSAGAIITSTQGFYGVGEQVQGGNESPMPLMSLGLAFTTTFVYCFRNSNNFVGTGNSTGQIIICNGALPSTVTLTRNGNTVSGQEPRELAPFELCYFYSNANGEYLIEATSPVMACVQAYMGSGAPVEVGDPASSSQRFYDARLIMPLTNDGITWPRSGYVSAPYDNTTSRYYVRDGVKGDFPTVSPNFPVDFDAGSSTGASDQDYEPRGATRLRVNGLATAYSGADSAGLEATPMMPVSGMSQVVAQPFFIDDLGDGGNSGVAIASPYSGTAKVYEWDTTTNSSVLVYTVPLERGTTGQGITPTLTEDQFYPCSGLVANEGLLSEDTSVIELNGDLKAGYVVADVPITVICQNASPTFVPEIRSQNGTTTTSIINDDDETLMLGWTPPNIKAEITTDTSGFTRKRTVDGSGVETWTLT